MTGPGLRRALLVYCALGVLCTLVQFAVLDVGVRAVGLAPVAASVIGFLAAATIGYFANRTLTFRSTRAHREALPRFVLIALLGLAMNASLMWVLVDVAQVHYLLAQAVTTGAVMFWNFGANLLWAFSRGR